MTPTLGNTVSQVPDMSKRNFVRRSAVASIMLVTGCASMQTIETVESIEKRIQRKFAGMPLVFGSKSNSIPDDIQVVASKDKKGIFILELPFFDSISEHKFKVNDNGAIVSDIIVIKFAQFDMMATILANKLNLNEGEKYRVTIEGGTMHIRLLPGDMILANSDGNAL